MNNSKTDNLYASIEAAEHIFKASSHCMINSLLWLPLSGKYSRLTLAYPNKIHSTAPLSRLTVNKCRLLWCWIYGLSPHTRPWCDSITTNRPNSLTAPSPNLLQCQHLDPELPFPLCLSSSCLLQGLTLAPLPPPQLYHRQLCAQENGRYHSSQCRLRDNCGHQHVILLPKADV